MITREKYCAICGCLFSLPDIRDPVNPDPDENPLLLYNDPYDSRILPLELTEWLTDFRVAGCWEDIDASLVNTSSAAKLFMSQPAKWEYGMGGGEPAIPTTAGKMAKIGVYEPVDDTNGMVFPIHKACLDILQRLCQIRQGKNEASLSGKPKSLGAFCHALQQRRRSNLMDTDKPLGNDEDYRYANSGGIEWPHDFYGARQFWADEWNTEPGWELLCADPSPLKIPNLPSYLLSEVPESSSRPATQMFSKNQVADCLGWLYPEEADLMAGNEKEYGDWETGIQILLQKSNMISAEEGGKEEGDKKLASAPLGLKNRWRIWKILHGISVSD